MAGELSEIMRDGETIERNLKLKQDAFFIACEQHGLTMGVIAARTGIPIESLRAYRTTKAREPSIMGLAAYVKIILGLSPEFTHLTSLLIEDTGCIVARSDPHAAKWLELGERMCATGAKIMRYQASDNHIDHVEDADLRTDMIEILSEGHAAIAGGAA